jgi:hypothetical protein
LPNLTPFSRAPNLSIRFSSLPTNEIMSSGSVSNNYKNVNFVAIPEIYKLNLIASAVSEAELKGGKGVKTTTSFLNSTTNKF